MVDRKAVNDMNKIQNILESSLTTNEVSSTDRCNIVSSNTGKKDHQMKNFLNITESFYLTAEKAVTSLPSKAQQDSKIAEALSTKRNEESVFIGEWQINIKPNGKYRKRYDVYHSESNQIIAKNLHVYEAALALVRLLNKGEAINGSKIKEILILEDKYANLLVETITYSINSKKAKQKKDIKRFRILEDRSSVCRAKADSIKEKLSNILDRL